MAARRGIALTETERARILDCADLPTLEAWLDGAATRADDIFRGDR